MSQIPCKITAPYMGPAFHTMQLTRPYMADSCLHLSLCVLIVTKNTNHKTLSYFSLKSAPMKYNFALQERGNKAMAEVLPLFFFFSKRQTRISPLPILKT